MILSYRPSGELYASCTGVGVASGAAFAPPSVYTTGSISGSDLIEIGAAMALFGKKVILLVEKDIGMPSNLQGLYRCEYEGGQLNYEATMKLLKTFSQFR